MTEMLSVDEQICATKARSSLKVYVPSKPHKYGYKFFTLCGEDGFCYDFEIYTGQVATLYSTEPDIGPSSNVVIRLCRSIVIYS